MTRTTASHELPLVVVPVGSDDAALDRCLAALDRATPADARIWLADDAQAGPRARDLIERWRRRTPLQAEYTRRQRSVGEVAHLDEVLAACAGRDVVVLAADAEPAPGWLQRMARTLADDRAIATVTPWSNAGEAAAWPRIGEVAPLPADLAALAAAAAAMPHAAPELPAAVSHAVLLRGAARQRVGGLDAAGYRSWHAALTDFSLRLAGLGWRNVLCEAAYVARVGEGRLAEGDMDMLAARWPDWHARLASFLMRDPLFVLRERLAERLAGTAEPGLQHDLFGPGTVGPDTARATVRELCGA